MSPLKIGDALYYWYTSDGSGGDGWREQPIVKTTPSFVYVAHDYWTDGRKTRISREELETNGNAWSQGRSSEYYYTLAGREAREAKDRAERAECVARRAQYEARENAGKPALYVVHASVQ